MRISKSYPVIAWWSGGAASAVTCWLCIQWYGVENVRVVFIDTGNEHPDTYRFLKDCEKWYGCKIEIIRNNKVDKIQDVWYDNLSLNIANGAICSSELKIKVRQDFIKRNNFSYNAFGFDIDEFGRAKDMKENNAHLNPIFPLIAMFYDKKDCIKVVEKANNMFLSIRVPETYRMGYSNNNCFQTGCVKGGIGYWQKIQREFPEKFDAMAKVEHDITDLKGEPVTICKDQSIGGGLVFLKPHPEYPDLKDISMMKGREPESLMECNGFCNNDRP